MRGSALVLMLLSGLVFSACESEGGGPSEVVLVPVEREASGSVTLGPEEGFLLAGATYQAVGEASTRGSDLLVYAAGDSVEIKPGEFEGRMVVNRPEGGGLPYRTTSLDEVPNEAPLTTALPAYLPNPKVGHSFTILGNGNGGYGRFRVTEEPDPTLGLAGIRVTLEYDVTWTELAPAD